MRPVVIALGLGFIGAMGLAIAAKPDKPVKPGLPAPPDPFMHPMTEEQVLGMWGTAAQYKQRVIAALGVTPAIGAAYPIAEYAHKAPPPGTLTQKDGTSLIAFSDRVKDLIKQRNQKLTAAKLSDDQKNAIRYQQPWTFLLAWDGSKFKVEYINRYGMAAPGHKNGGFDPLSVLSIAANYTLPFVPGVGTAANAALQGAIALGRGESLVDAAKAAIRGALPPWGQVAFDLGVGVVLEGKPPDEAAIDAGLEWLEQQYPGAKDAYALGKKTVKDYTTGLSPMALMLL